MAPMLVTYDLGVDGDQDYPDMLKALRSFPTWCRVTKSTWVVVTGLTPDQIANKLTPFLSQPDRLLIAPLATGRGWWSVGLSPNVLAWLRRNLAGAPTPAQAALTSFGSSFDAHCQSAGAAVAFAEYSQGLSQEKGTAHNYAPSERNCALSPRRPISARATKRYRQPSLTQPQQGASRSRPAADGQWRRATAPPPRLPTPRRQCGYACFRWPAAPAAPSAASPPPPSAGNGTPTSRRRRVCQSAVQ